MGPNAASSTIVANTASYASMLHYSCNVSAPACSALAKIMVCLDNQPGLGEPPVNPHPE